MLRHVSQLAFVLASAVGLSACQPDQASISQTAPTQTRAPQPAASANQKTYDGPFGLAAGMPIAEISALGFQTAPGQSSVFVGEPPKPLEGVDEYAVIATPKAGLCRLRATTNVSAVNGDGEQLRAAVDRIADLMAIRYGEHSMRADLNDREVYKSNPQLWMLGLTDNSVMYGYVWNGTKTKKPLPNRITNIEVTAQAESVDKGIVSILYSFDNFDDCRQENQARAASKL